MEDKCTTSVSHFVSSHRDIIVLSSEDEEKKRSLIKSGSKVRRKVRRRLVIDREIKHMDLDYGDREWSGNDEDSDKESLTGSDDLVVTQFESPMKKVFTPTKKPRMDELQSDTDSSDNELREAENRDVDSDKGGYSRYVFGGGLY